MNALVGFRANATGVLSITPVERAEAAQRLASVAQRANGIATKAAAYVQKAEAAGEATREVTSELDKDAFLQLLVLEMQNQDPLDPTDNTEMLAQLAQFSSLEQMNNLNESFVRLSGNVDQLNFISAGALLGRQVTGIDLEGETIEGTVECVQLNGSVVYLTVDGTLMSMAGVLGIEPLSD